MRITASGLARVAACPPSAALPGSSRTSEYATRGNVLHAFLQRCQEAGRDAALTEQSDEWRDVCAALDTDALPVNGDYAAEVAFALNVVTGQARVLGVGLNRDYSGCSGNEIAGTADVIGLLDGAVYVADFKTGYLEIPSAKNGWQSRFLSLCASRAYDRPRVISDVIRVRPDEDPWIDRATFDDFDLAMAEQELAGVIAQADIAASVLQAGRIPGVREGEHCRYCQALYTCPAKVALVRSLAVPQMDRVEHLVGELNPATAGEAYRRVIAVEAVIGLVKQRIYEIARTRPIAIGDGEYLGEQTAPGNEKLDGDGTYQAVVAQWGEDLAEIAAPAERKATKKGIKEAAKIAKERGLVKSLAAGEREMLETLRESGCAQKPIVTKVTKYKAAACRTDGCSEQAMTDGGTCGLCAIDLEIGEVA